MRREVVAHHEAGHAVAAVLLKCTLYSVTIRAGDGSGGHALHRSAGAVDDTEAFVAREVIVTASGPTAQARVQKRAARKVLEMDPRCAADLRQIMDGLLHLGEGEQVEMISPVTGNIISGFNAEKGFLRIVREAESLVRANWSAVSAIAGELLVRETLPGSEVRRIVKQLRSEAAIEREPKKRGKAK